MKLNPSLRISPASKLVLLLFLAVLGAAPRAGAQTGLQPQTQLNNGGPINIAADNLEVNELERVLIFAGNVVARQGGLTLSCNWMKVAYSNRPQAGNSSNGEPGAGNLLDSGDQAIDRIDCQGAVQISQNDQVAVGDQAVYLARNTPRRIVLTGNARLWQGKDYLSGHQVTYYLDEGRSVVEGADGQRVRATYYQNETKEPPNGSDSLKGARP